MAVRLLGATDAATSSCRFCESHVTPDFRRNYGDDHGVAHRCPECDSWTRIVRGSAMGRDVDIPDPVENPERRGGKTAEDLPTVMTQ